MAFLQQIKSWCYAQMLEQYEKELDKPAGKRRLIVFVSDKFGNYKAAWSKLFSRITKMQFGHPYCLQKNFG